MGGMDLADMLIALYRSPYKSKRWYMGIFTQLVDICINNGWLLYRRQMDAMGQPKHVKLKKFKTEIAIFPIKAKNSENQVSPMTNLSKKSKCLLPPGQAMTSGTTMLVISQYLWRKAVANYAQTVKLLFFVSGNNTRNFSRSLTKETFIG
ncbi:hypothetical protein HHI36_014847 [Cryptolaemus montrouzieri]|uniref:PiggyBac transposable element-derived protein domain-containing protein n=1 Tax=Cryptolaemus montrouzieri TaxID=559131 RepID=A0ABD2N516_9CUCU